MQRFKDVIKAELERRGWSAYRLGKESGAPIRMLQYWMAHTIGQTAEYLEKVLNALDLEIRPKRKGKGR